jgi:hypothetical protein
MKHPDRSNLTGGMCSTACERGQGAYLEHGGSVGDSIQAEGIRSFFNAA